MVVSNKPDLCCETESVADGTASESLINVEAKVSGKHILIRIQCQNHNGFLVKIVTEIQNYQLFVVNNNVMALGDSIVDITIIAEVKDILFTSVKRFRIVFHYFFSSHYCTDWRRLQLDHKGTRPEPTHGSIEVYVIKLTRHECFDVPFDTSLTHTK